MSCEECSGELQRAQLTGGMLGIALGAVVMFAVLRLGLLGAATP